MPGAPHRAQRPRALPGRLVAFFASTRPERPRAARQEEAARLTSGPRSTRSTAGFGETRPRQADHGLRHGQDLHLAAARRGERRRRRQGALPGPLASACSPRPCASGWPRPSCRSGRSRSAPTPSRPKRSANATRTSRPPTSRSRPRPTSPCCKQRLDGRRRRHRGDDGGLLDLPVDRRRRPGAAGPAAVRPDRLPTRRTARPAPRSPATTSRRSSACTTTPTCRPPSGST